MKAHSTVLIVDDHPAVRTIISRVLQTQPYELLMASNGVEALEIAERVRPDLILLDVMMPNGMNGFEVCRRLRANPDLKDVPVLMITALDDRESRLEGINSGADDFIVKPFDPVELQARVANITKLNRFRRLVVERLKFEWVVEESDEGYLIVGGDDHILYANSRAKLFLNLPPHVPLAENQLKFLSTIRKLYNCEPAKLWENWPADENIQDKAARYLIRPETQQAAAFWLKVTGLSLPLGNETWYAIRLRDVTQQMTERRDVWQLHSMIFHKLRTPFTSILMSLELLNKYGADMNPKERSSVYDSALSQAERLNHVIDSMLKYVNSTALSSQHESFPVGQVEDLVRKASESLEITHVDCHIAPEIYFHQLRLTDDTLTMIMWEVLRNAQKFHPEKMPHITVDVEQVSPNMARLKVMDDGVYLSPEQLIAVWQPYYQGERDFTGELPGAGLGLTAVAMLTWQVGGKYQIYNRSDRPGVIVELILPIGEPHI